MRRAAVGRRRSATRRLVGAGLVVLGLALPSIGPAVAQSNAYVCNELTARMAALAKAPASAADRWARAIAEQKAAIEQNRGSLARCGGVSDPRCAAIAARGEQMAANLDNLQRQYGRMGGERAAGSPERARLEALMAQMRCGQRDPLTPVNADGTAPPPSVPSRVTIGGLPPGTRMTPEDTPPGVGPARIRTPSSSGGFFSLLFGGGNEPGPGDTWEEEVDPGLADQLSGSYRTLCVRTCDGYYFPISFTAPKGRLSTDANVCKALCPGTETRLYYHHNPGEEAEQAVAADTGEPITRLPNAFRYRTQVVPACACGRPDPSLLPAAAGGFRGPRDAAARGFSLADLPLPTPRPAPDEDPETIADFLAGWTPGGLIAITPSEAPPAKVAHDERPPAKVRTVGPKYFSDR